MAVVVGAGRLERPGETVEAELLEAGGVDIEVLEAAAHVPEASTTFLPVIFCAVLMASAMITEL